MPKPRKNEKKNPFISRCVRQLVHEEGKEPKAAVGECYGIWDEHKKKDLDVTRANYKFLHFLKGIPPPKDEEMVQCDHCLAYFKYSNYMEEGMGYIKCPNCGRNIDQEGKGAKKCTENANLEKNQSTNNEIQPNEGGE
jgi:hypothetical protein